MTFLNVFAGAADFSFVPGAGAYAMDHESEVKNERQHRRTHLFTVRLWIEQIAEDQVEVRGQVQHVLSSEARHFRKWMELTIFFDEMLQKLEGTSSVEKQSKDD